MHIMIMDPIRIVVAGDLMPSENNYVLFESGDAEMLFSKEICQLVASADFSIANLEGPLTDSDIPQVKDGPGIKAPKTTIAGIKNLGLKALALANNHITDYLQQGINDTYGTLNDAGIQFVGNETREGAGGSITNNYISIVLRGKRVCIYNVSETFFNRPTKEHDGAFVYDEWLVLNQIKELKNSHDFLIVLYHGGAEYLPYPTPQTHLRFHRMADCGADFITSQHTHCIGCEEWYQGSYLLHGQGNFLFARQKKYPNMTKEGLVTEIIISQGGFTVLNHKVIIDGNVLRYDKEQDLSCFKARSLRLADKEFIIKEYQKLKVDELMHKYLIAAKGDYPLRRITSRICRRMARYPETTYSLGQVLRNYNVLQGDRRREDMYYVWKYLLDLYMKDGEQNKDY